MKTATAINVLYVYNKTNAILTFNVESANGRVQTIKLPKTWIPIDITMQARYRDIVESPNYRRVLAQGYISVADEDEAAKILASADAREEQKRILNVDQQLFETLGKSNTSVVDTTSVNSDEDEIAIAKLFSIPENEALTDLRMMQQRKDPNFNEQFLIKVAEQATKSGYTKVFEFVEKASK